MVTCQIVRLLENSFIFIGEEVVAEKILLSAHCILFTMAKKSTTIHLWTILLSTSVGIIWENLASGKLKCQNFCCLEDFEQLFLSIVNYVFDENQLLFFKQFIVDVSLLFILKLEFNICSIVN